MKGVCESIIHAVSDLIFSSPADQCWTLLLDFSNAFISVNQESMLAQFRQHMHTLLILQDEILLFLPTSVSDG